MDRKQMIQYMSDNENYLEQKGVYQTFDHLLKQLVIAQPDNPIDYLISQLQKPEGKKMFILGPPGGMSVSLCDFLRNQQNLKIVQAGKAIKAAALNDNQLNQTMKKFTNIPDKKALEIMENEFGKIDSRGNNILIEGFPKTRVQALEWQKKGIIPEIVVIIKMEKEKIVGKCLEKIQNGEYEHIRKQDQEALAINYAEEYILNLEQVKKLYQNIYEIDETVSQSEAENQIEKLVQYKFYKKIPNNLAYIFIQGMPGLLVFRQFFLFKAQEKQKLPNIQLKNTELRMFQSMKFCLPKFVTRQLLESGCFRTYKTMNWCPMKQLSDCCTGDCNKRIAKFQGFCLNLHLFSYIVDGFPKTQSQLNSIKELKIKVSNVFLLELETTDAFERISGSQIDPKTGIIYDRCALSKLENEEIKQRLYEMQNATEEQISERLLFKELAILFRIKRWKAIEKKMKETFSFAVEINALLPEQSIKERVCEVLDIK